MSDGLSNPQIEKILLGAMLADEQVYWDTSEILNSNCFSAEDHQKVYGIVSDIAISGRAIRLAIVAGRLSGLSGGIEPEAYLAALLHAATMDDAIPVIDFAHELLELSTKRRLKEVGEGIVSASVDKKHDATMILDRAVERLADIASDATSEHETGLSATVREIARNSSAQKSGMGIQPCLLGLEEMVGTFMPGALVLWGGGPGSAKTSAAVQQAIFSSSIHPVSFFELEMDNKSMVARALVGPTGIGSREIMRGLDPSQADRIMAVESEWSSHRMKIVSPPQMTIQQLRSRALHHKRNHGLDLMVVDHIKLIRRPTKHRMTDFERAYENAGDLKALAKELGCCIIALCQFTKSARTKEGNPEPDMEDFYGGSLEEHADVMLANFNRYDWLQKNPPKTNQGKAKQDWDDKVTVSRNRIEIHKLKDRFGAPRDRRIFHWDGVRTLISDLSAVQEELL